MLTTLHRYAATLACLCLALQGFSQEQPDSASSKPAVPITRVVIEAPGPRLLDVQSRETTIITAQTIDLLPSSSFAGVLESQAGIDVRQRGPFGIQADLSIRGSTFNQVLVLLNGFKLTDPMTGHFLLNLPVAPEDVQRIELLEGQGTMRFGQNAFAGAVNFVVAPEDAFSLRLLTEGGEFNSYRYRAALNLPVGGYKQQLIIGQASSDGYLPNTDFFSQDVFYQGQIDLNGGLQTLDLMAGYQKKDFGARQFYGSSTEQYEYNEASFVALGGNMLFGSLQFSPRLYARHHYDDYYWLRTGPSTNKHSTDVLSGELRVSKYNKLSTTAFGVEWRQESIVSTNMGEHTRPYWGAFVNHTFHSNGLQEKAWQLTPGLYANNLPRYGFQVFPGLEGYYTLSSNTRFRANVGRSFRMPTFIELYFNVGNTVSNPSLTPEDAWTYEVGLDKTYRQLQFSATAFVQDAKQLIDWARPAEVVAGPDTARNINEVLTYGLRGQVNWQSSPTIAAENFTRVQLGYQWLGLDAQAADDNVRSRYVLNYLVHQLTAQLTQQVRDISFTLSTRFEERYNYKSYLLLDARVQYATAFGNDAMRVYAQGSNLTAVPYEDVNGVQMPGSWFSIGAEYTLR